MTSGSADMPGELPAEAAGGVPDAALEVDVAGRTFHAADGSTLHAVGRLRFALAPNSFTCIVGPSGCGKTTTLRMIIGLDRSSRVG